MKILTPHPTSKKEALQYMKRMRRIYPKYRFKAYPLMEGNDYIIIAEKKVK